MEEGYKSGFSRESELIDGGDISGMLFKTNKTKDLFLITVSNQLFSSSRHMQISIYNANNYADVFLHANGTKFEEQELNSLSNNCNTSSGFGVCDETVTIKNDTFLERFQNKEIAHTLLNIAEDSHNCTLSLFETKKDFRGLGFGGVMMEAAERISYNLNCNKIIGFMMPLEPYVKRTDVGLLNRSKNKVVLNVLSKIVGGVREVTDKYKFPFVEELDNRYYEDKYKEAIKATYDIYKKLGFSISDIGGSTSKVFMLSKQINPNNWVGGKSFNRAFNFDNKERDYCVSSRL